MLIEPLIIEEWKSLDIYPIKPNMYLISNFGRIYSNTKQGIMSPAISNGYLTVQLTLIDGSRKTFYIHRLVAISFIPNPDPELFTDANHKNLYRDDAFYGNLEWVTKKENNLHERANRGHGISQLSGNKKWGDGSKTYGENNGMSKLTEHDIRKILSAIESGSSYSEALLIAGIEPTENMRYNVSHIVRGHRWKHISKDYKIPENIPRSII